MLLSVVLGQTAPKDIKFILLEDFMKELNWFSFDFVLPFKDFVMYIILNLKHLYIEAFKWILSKR